MRRTIFYWAALWATLGLVSGCGSDSGDGTCDLTDPDSGDCDNGEVCAEVLGSPDGQCFLPVQVKGMVFDAVTDAAVEGALVVGLDANGAAISSVAVTGADGNYTLEVPVRRDDMGAPNDDAITLRVTAAEYQTFAKAPRTALPIEVTPTAAVETDEAYEISNVATDVALIPLEGDTSGLRSIEGSVDPATAGMLVIAVQGGEAVATAVTDADGNYTLFNVPEGSTDVYALREGSWTDTTTVADPGDLAGVTLSVRTDALVSVSGSLQFVAGGAPPTTVILVAADTFDSTLNLGEAPTGLRVVDVSSTFTFENVPPGEYAVLAAFENDGQVRDPNTCTAGTDIVFITVNEGDPDLTIAESFKVTAALDVVSPGATSIETVTDPTPDFVWGNISNEDGFRFHLYDSFGNLVHEEPMLASVSGSSTPVTYTYDGPALEDGMIYQFRVWAWSENQAQGVCEQSSTEDLRGVFEFSAATL